MELITDPRILPQILNIGIESEGGISLEAIGARIEKTPPEILTRHVMWLLKFGFLQRMVKSVG